MHDIQLSSATHSGTIIPHLITPAGVNNQSELWGQPDANSMRSNCSICYRPDLGQKLWGFTLVNIMLDVFLDITHSALVNLRNMGYVYV